MRPTLLTLHNSGWFLAPLAHSQPQNVLAIAKQQKKSKDHQQTAQLGSVYPVPAGNRLRQKARAIITFCCYPLCLTDQTQDW